MQAEIIQNAVLERDYHRPNLLGDFARVEAERFIRNAYADVYEAELEMFMKDLRISYDKDSKIQYVYGQLNASFKTLFLESYLQQPIEKIISKHVGKVVTRDKIVEVGNLAIAKETDSMSALRGIAYDLRSQGFEWIVCTASRYLRWLFYQCGTRPYQLTAAKKENVKATANNWGSYYDVSPQVLFGDLLQCIDCMDEKQRKAKH